MSTYESIPPFSRYGQGDAHMSPWQLYKNSGWDTDVAPFSGLVGPVFNVKAFGALGTGADDSTAIQAAITAAAVRGGTVWFPCNNGETYGLLTGLLVSSKYPVVLQSNMLGMSGIMQNGFQSYIKPLSGFNSATDMIRFATPSANRNEGGGGAVIGLSFWDPTHRTVSIRSALRCEDFNFAIVRDCYFHELLGSAIITDFTVMSSFDRCIIRYCGDTSKSALQVGVTSGGGFVTQSTTFRDFRMEVNYLAPYVNMPAGTNQYGNKFLMLQCECDTAIANSNQLYLSVASDYNRFIGCLFQRNTGTSVSVSGNRNMWSECHFDSDPGLNPQFTDTNAGTFNFLTSCDFSGGISNTTGTGFSSTGYTVLTGCDFYAGGKIVCSGPYFRMVNCNVRNLAATGANYAVDMQGGESSFIGGQITGNAIGGIKLTGTTPACIGAEISSNTGIGILVNSSNGTVIGNHLFGNGGADISFVDSGKYASRVELNSCLSSTKSALRRGGEQMLGRLIGANFNITTDQSIPMGSRNYRITRIEVTNASISLTTAAGGIYTAAAKGGTAIVAAGQAYAALTTTLKALDLTLANTDRWTIDPQLSLTTGQGSAATADVYVYGHAFDDSN